MSERCLVLGIERGKERARGKEAKREFLVYTTQFSFGLRTSIKVMLKSTEKREVGVGMSLLKERELRCRLHTALLFRRRRT